MKQLDGSVRQILVYRSEHYDRVSTQRFKPFRLNVSDIGGLDKYFYVRCLDYEASGDHQLIGELVTSLREWLYVVPGSPYRQKLVDKGALQSSKSRGAFIVEACVPLAAKDLKMYPPAYRFMVSAQQVESKDGLLSKSGATQPTSIHPSIHPSIRFVINHYFFYYRSIL